MLRDTEQAISAMIADLNTRHFAIELANNRRMLFNIDTSRAEPRLYLMADDKMRLRYINKRLIIGIRSDGAPVYRSAGDLWLSHPDARRYSAADFLPSGALDRSTPNS